MTNLACIALRKPAGVSSAASSAAIVFGIALALAPTWSRAETKVQGTPQAVSVEAENASVEEILAALTDKFGVRFRSAANLDKRLTGTYEGTLQQAVSHILKGYDFVVKSGTAGLEITLLGSGKPVAVVGAQQAPKAAAAATSAGATPQPITTANASAGPVPVPTSGGPTPPIRVAQGPAPVPTPPTSGAAPAPVPQLGTGPAPAPTPPLPGAAPTPVPPMPTASSAMPPPPTGAPSTAAPPTPPTAGSPLVAPSTAAPPAPPR